MILTVTPNAVVDKTYRVEGFRLNVVNRPSLTHTVAGGKGVNVARVYQRLGGDAIATGFLGGLQGRIVTRALAEEGIADAFVRVAGETRICIAIIDPTTGTQTEVNEQGPEIPPRAAAALKRRYSSLLSQRAFDCVVLSGSLPPGAPETLYADLIELARTHGIRAALDTSGSALRCGLEARPWLVKPNRAELEALLGASFTTEAALFAAGRSLLDRAEMVALSLGERGAALFTPSGAWRSVPPKIEFASAVASGDSFVAAFLWAWQEGDSPGDPAQALRLATGAGAANAAVIGAGFCTRESIFTLAERAQIAIL